MWQDSTLISIEKETEITWKFVIKVHSDFKYIPGQFVQIKVNDLVRSYSISSYGIDGNIFELIIVNLEGGKMTNYLFEKAKEGDNILIKGPLGKFTLPETISGDVLFICTGTGIAPFRSILQSLVNQKINHKNIYLIFGTREKKDILYPEEMKNFEKLIKGFKYIPVLSRENWEGMTGYVHNQYLDLINNNKLEDPIFYLCGWRDMIKEARGNLKELGFNSKKIKLEIYG